eukprot:gene11265-18891_t
MVDLLRNVYADLEFRSQVTYSNVTYVGPMRPSEVEITEENLNLWDSQGFNQNDTIRFLMATGKVFKSTNLHLQLRIHDAGKYRTALGLAEVPAPSNLPLEAEEAHGLDKQVLIIIIVIPIVVGLSLIGGLLFLWAGKLPFRRTLLKSLTKLRLTPPGVIPSTTLVITDIESSSSMWEWFPSDVMDEALVVHHRTVRNSLNSWAGYESATEGDSFILAFHTAQDAVMFSAESQEALMLAPWPQALLQHPLCAPVYVKASPLMGDLIGMDYSKLSIGAMSGALLGQLHLSSTSRRGLPTVTAFPMSNTFNEEETEVPMNWREFLVLDLKVSNTLPNMFSSGDSLKAVNEKSGYVLVWRGLRVRMGIHSGVTDALCIDFNRISGSTHYGGEFMALAKAVQGVACGGMVLCSAATFQELPLRDLSPIVCVAHVGEHVLEEEKKKKVLAHPSRNLYNSGLSMFSDVTTYEPETTRGNATH